MTTEDCGGGIGDQTVSPSLTASAELLFSEPIITGFEVLLGNRLFNVQQKVNEENDCKCV